MVDKEMLEAIGQMMDTKLEQFEVKVDEKLAAQRKEFMQDVVTLMDAEFKPRFDLLAEGQKNILEKLVPRSRVDDLEDEVKFLKSIVRQMNEDLQHLKQAN